MDYEMCPVISLQDLEEAVNEHFNTNYDLVEILFDSCVENDSYEYIDRRGFFTDDDNGRDPNWKEKNDVLFILKQTFPQYDGVVVNISW